MNIALWIAQGLLAAMYLTAGDDADAKSRVAELVRDAGMRPVDTGPLSRARQIEGMQLLHIVTQETLGTHWGSAVKILG